MNRCVKKIRTFIFQKAWGQIFQNLSDEDAGRLIKAILIFANGDDPDLSDDNQLEALFLIISDQIEESAKRYLSRTGFETN